MITGAKYWNDRGKAFFIQTDNPTDSLLRKVLKKFDPYYLETCGPTASCSCLAALGYNLEIQTPGGYKPQPEEVLQDWLNDPNTAGIREGIRKGVGYLPGNRIPQFYPEAVHQVFNVKGAIFSWSGTSWDKITKYLQEGKTVQLCLKRPGHYIAAVAFDDETGEIVFNDPWPQRRGLVNGGFNEHLDREEFSRNIQGYCIVYKGP